MEPFADIMRLKGYYPMAPAQEERAINLLSMASSLLVGECLETGTPLPDKEKDEHRYELFARITPAYAGNT